MPAAIADSGPLVAFLDRAERHHTWVVARIDELDAPLLVCEPVLAEAMHLLARLPVAREALLGLIENGALRIALDIEATSPSCAASSASTATSPCRWPTPAWPAWPSSTTTTPS